MILNLFATNGADRMTLPSTASLLLLAGSLLLAADPACAQASAPLSLPDAPSTVLFPAASAPEVADASFPGWQPRPLFPGPDSPDSTGSTASDDDSDAPQSFTGKATAPRPIVKNADADADEPPTFMKWLSDRGLHNLENERWNAYGQITYIYGWKKAFYAPYTNADGSINSLLPTPEQSYTGTATLYLGARPWKGAEAYFVPELISEKPLSQLRGLGSAIQDFELQKGGAEIPTLYSSRSYLRQTFNFGGEHEHQDSGPTSLGGSYDSRRLVLIAGDFSVLDFFDKNPFDIDPRLGSYFGLAFLTYAPWDFASDARGYSWGFLSEFYWDKWEVRYARLAPPKDPNQLAVDFRFFKYYGDQVEFVHHHELRGKEGTVRLLTYRNHEDIGRFSDAIAAFDANPAENATTCTGFNYGSNNATAPDLCWVRKPNNKVGIGMYGEQYLTKDIGVFARGMYADGKTEVDAYTPTDRALSFGVLAKGNSWGRPQDYTGVAVNIGWISDVHARYLGMGGIDGFIGDGHISAAPEGTFDVFYTYNIHKSYWLSGDYQRVTNPAMNSARGPVDIFNVKVHAEF
jgi:high affinity Mn2+ porin